MLGGRIGPSTPLSQPIAISLLKNRIQAAQEEEENKGSTIISSESETQAAILEISVRLTPQAILQIASLALVLVSSLLWPEFFILQKLTNATALENIAFSMHISRVKAKKKKEGAYAILEKVGINRETANRKVLKLSGGEQQRVGIARALSHDPDLVIADEPTGNLDSGTEDNIMQIFVKLPTCRESASSSSPIPRKCLLSATVSSIWKKGSCD